MNEKELKINICPGTIADDGVKVTEALMKKTGYSYSSSTNYGQTGIVVGNVDTFNPTLTTELQFRYIPTIKYMPTIKKVIFCPPATIVMWYDGTKTVVKTHGEEFSEEHGLAMAIAKKHFGSRAEFLRVVKGAKRVEPKEKDTNRKPKAVSKSTKTVKRTSKKTTTKKTTTKTSKGKK